MLVLSLRHTILTMVPDFHPQIQISVQMCLPTTDQNIQPYYLRHILYFQAAYVKSQPILLTHYLFHIRVSIGVVALRAHVTTCPCGTGSEGGGVLLGQLSTFNDQHNYLPYVGYHN